MKMHRGHATSLLLGACIIFSFIGIIAARSNGVVTRADDQGFPGLASPSSIHASQAGSFSDVFAVIAGISDYPGTDNDLEYCDDDEVDIYNMLRLQFHVPATHITPLVNDQATPEAIARAIDDFAGVMDEDDYLLFYFSGHGSNSVTATSTISWNTASSHPYSNGQDIYWHYSSPGAEFLRVHFTRVETEANYDAVFVGDNYDRASAYDMFTGNYNDVWSAWVPTNDIYVELYTDVSNTYWGFAVDKVQTGVYSSPYFIHPYEIGLAGMSGPTIDAHLDNVPGKVVTILDSCMSGGVAADIAATDRYTIAASAYNEYSLEDSANHNGAFTYQFLNAWSSATDSNIDGAISFEEVFPITYSGTVSQSESLGSVHHPVQVDNVAGDVIFDPNAVLGTVSENGSTHDLSFDFRHSGVGLGDLIVAYYDAGTHNYQIGYSSTGMIGQDGIRSVNVSAPGGFTVNGYSVVLKASFYDASELQASFRQDAGTFNTTTDSDGDGYSDQYEFEHAMNPWSSDTDGDGLTDAQEMALNFNSIVNDLSRDFDGDFIPNLWEMQHGLDPTELSLVTDQDNDALRDWQEFKYGGNPENPDTDGDGLTDGKEYELDFDLVDPDMDDDGFSDGVEYYLGMNPQDPNDTPWMHVIAIAVVVGVPLLIALISKSKGKARRPAPPGPRPTEKSRVTQPSRPIPTIPATQYGSVYPIRSVPPTLGSFPPAVPAPSGTVTYASYNQGPRYSSPIAPAPNIAPAIQPSSPVSGQMTQLPPLAPDIQRQLDSMPPDQREAVKRMILQKINERIAQGSATDEPVEAPSAGSRFCIHCGAALTGKWCGSCGWDSGELL